MARGEGEVRAAGRNVTLPGSGGSAGSGGVASVFHLALSCVFFIILGDSGDAPVQCIFLLFKDSLVQNIYFLDILLTVSFQTCSRNL